jgi:diguanylate cyclase (GGDEF)-like protein
MRVGRRRAHTQWGGPGISMRLFALPLIPLLLVFWVSSLVVGPAQRTAERARQIEQGVPKTDALLRLSVTLHDEMTAADLTAIGTPQVLHALGLNYDYPTASKATNQALAVVKNLLPNQTPKFEVWLAQARKAIQTKTPDKIISAYNTLDLGILQELQTQEHALDLIAHKISDGGSELSDALTVLADLGAAMHYRTWQVADASGLLFHSNTPTALLEVTFGRDSALYLEASNKLLASPTGSVPGKWRSYRDNPAIKHLDDFMNSLIKGGQGSSEEVISSINTLGVMSNAFNKVEAQADTTLVSLAHQVESRATATLRNTAIALGACLLVVCVYAVRASRSIGNPLRDLAASAQSVSDGRLDGDSAQVRGPREIRQVTRAFNDLVGNLRLLETKALALAGLDLGNPALHTPLPGRLGAAIDDSMRVLSESVSQRDLLAQELAHEASHDALTRLPNRATALEAIDAALARGTRAGQPVAVLFIDLDGFKLINDIHGHSVGDALLVEVALRMKTLLRDGDLVARLGGDEFLIIAESTDAAGATMLGRRIVETVGTPIDISGHRVSVGASVGIAMSLDGSTDASHFLSRADLALYRAKGGGRGRVEIFDESLQRELNERDDIQQGMQATLERGGDEFELNYQPVIDTVSSKTRGVEALIRWRRPGIGLVPPDSFIPIAETSNLIVDLDLWVLETATRQAAEWHTNPEMAGLSVAVNISGRHLLSGRLPNHLADILARTGMNPLKLVVEITETVLVTDLSMVSVQLDQIRRTGVRIAIDDFGTGFTSLTALRTLPVDVIKVDRSFISQLDQASDRSLVSMVTHLGHELGATIVAEGVETHAQLEALRELGADQVQGYLISRPISAAEFVRAFTSHPLVGA